MVSIHTSVITKAIAELCEDACCNLPDDTRRLIDNAIKKEESPFGLNILEQIKQNIDICDRDNLPLCQDTGMAVVFLDIGQDVHITGDNVYDAVNQGVREGYKNLRKSVLSPLKRVNTGDNTPAIIHTRIVPGSEIKITIAPKGFGSENMSRLIMLKPSDGLDRVAEFIINTVKKAGANPCPPIILGVGIGGTMEMAAIMAKRALIRKGGMPNNDVETADLERYVLDRVNSLGIGPQGLGGRVTALAVHIDTYPTHIAGLPVAVNVQCHSSRHAEIILRGDDCD